MNWYKMSQKYAPVAISSYIPSFGELTIVFNGGKRYVYENVGPRDYAYLQNLLKNHNYKKAQGFLSHLYNKETEEDRREMLKELYERGVII